MKAQVANEGLVEFAPIVPLYADEAMQRRFAWFPEGSQIGYDPTARSTSPSLRQAPLARETHAAN